MHVTFQYNDKTYMGNGHCVLFQGNIYRILVFSLFNSQFMYTTTLNEGKIHNFLVNFNNNNVLMHEPGLLSLLFGASVLFQFTINFTRYSFRHYPIGVLCNLDARISKRNTKVQTNLFQIFLCFLKNWIQKKIFSKIYSAESQFLVKRNKIFNKISDFITACSSNFNK